MSYSLAGAGVFADALRHSQRHLKVIAVLGAGEEPISAFSGADATQHRPSLVDEGSEREWLEMIEGVFPVVVQRPESYQSGAAKPS